MIVIKKMTLLALKSISIDLAIMLNLDNWLEGLAADQIALEWSMDIKITKNASYTTKKCAG